MSHSDDSYQVPAGTCYCVGGAVRDALLKRPCEDKDYVVVGASPEQLAAAGFRPVGEDFPVFLHPRSKNAYALARTERKSGRGYHGFIFYSAPTVTLEQDLKRRDLTINAMAMDAAGTIIDYYGGRDDLSAKILRHVSPAFAEDPVRILRVARFAAMLPEFTIADETLALMRRMVETGEAHALQKERVWRELARGLTAARPSKMVQALSDCGMLQLLLPEVAALQGVPERLDYHPEGDSYVHTLMVIDTAAARGCNADECFAALLHDIGKAQTPAQILPSHHGHEQRSANLVRQLCIRLQPPRAAAHLALIAAAEHGNVHKVLEMRPATAVDLIVRLDAFRRSKRFDSVLHICEADFYYLPQRAADVYQQGEFLRRAQSALQALDNGTIAQRVKEKAAPPFADKIAAAIRSERIKTVQALKRANN